MVPVRHGEYDGAEEARPKEVRMRCDTHPDQRDDRVAVTLEFGREDLHLATTPFGLVVSLQHLKSGGEPGAPALPRTQVRIAVPDRTWPHELEILDETWETVVDTPSFVVPAQRLRAGAGRRAKPPDDEPDRAEQDGERGDCSCCARPLRPDKPSTEGFPVPEFTPPDPGRYAAAASDPPPAARAVRIDTIGTHHVAVVEVAPVRLTRDGGVQLCTALTLAVRHASEPPLGDRGDAVESLRELLGRDIDPERVVPRPEPVLTGPAEAERLHDLARDLVINRSVISDAVSAVRWPWPYLDLPCAYLVITDDVRWDAAAIRPTTQVPGVIAEFERLAAAKRARGITARVVTITDIVGGRFGDFRSGARDLQEVIRSFLKSVRTRWGVSWLLLGGDVSVVPIRQVAGAMQGHITRDAKTDPDDNRSHWTGSFLKMKVVSPGDWWAASTMNQLVRSDTGQLVPYDSAGTSNTTTAGWYFTASDWSTRSSTPTEYVRVNGPAAAADGDFMFLYAWNMLPTDLYYASLASWVVGQHTYDFGWFRFQIPYVYEPDHDWDALGNGIYGQHRSDGTDLDGAHLATDLSVGRAPVEAAAEARAFVDKVLAYERLGGGLFQPVDRSWPTRLLLASSDWGGPVRFWPTPSTTPTDNRYHHDPGAQRSLLKSPAAPSTFDVELIAHVSDSDRRIIPAKSSTDPSVRGWYFARSATDTSINELVFPLPWFTFRIPLPSPWIVVHGPPTERTPQLFALDSRGQDGSMADQEQLRRQVAAELPAINDVQRLYEDELDLTLAERIAAPVQFLTSARLRSALDAAPHFVSLSGHGNSDGCCDGSVWMAGALRNGAPGFIGYADSCLTNQIDADDAFSEALITNPAGGAVAYVGNTRFSWIGVGDDFQRAFFHRLTTTRHLGLLNDSRIGVYGTTGAWTGYDRWAVFTLNLLGDPELRVYRAPLPRLRIELLDDLMIKVKAVIDQPRPSQPFPDPPPLHAIRVHVRTGDDTFDALTDEAGEVRLPAVFAGRSDVEVTASRDDVVTVHEVIAIARPDEHERCRCCTCTCCHDH
jgi:hypothetical protein